MYHYTAWRVWLRNGIIVSTELHIDLDSRKTTGSVVGDKREAGQHQRQRGETRCLAPACVLGYCAIFFVIIIIIYFTDLQYKERSFWYGQEKSSESCC